MIIQAVALILATITGNEWTSAFWCNAERGVGIKWSEQDLTGTLFGWHDGTTYRIDSVYPSWQGALLCDPDDGIFFVNARSGSDLKQFELKYVQLETCQNLPEPLVGTLDLPTRYGFLTGISESTNELFVLQEISEAEHDQGIDVVFDIYSYEKDGSGVAASSIGESVRLQMHARPKAYILALVDKGVALVALDRLSDESGLPCERLYYAARQGQEAVDGEPQREWQFQPGWFPVGLWPMDGSVDGKWAVAFNRQVLPEDRSYISGLAIGTLTQIAEGRAPTTWSRTAIRADIAPNHTKMLFANEGQLFEWDGTGDSIKTGIAIDRSASKLAVLPGKRGLLVWFANPQKTGVHLVNLED